MAYKSDILLGRITKLSGYEGAVAVKLEKIFSENIPEMESVYLEIEGRLVPFFISDLEYSGADILKLKFESYNTIEKVNEFIGARVFLTTIVPVQDESVNFQSFHGFQVFNQHNVLVGEIADVIPNPGQLLLSINSGENKEILIPFHEHFILSVNKRKKIIVMNLPEGLIDINL
jgi:16S rRNA processing protein RimM